MFRDTTVMSSITLSELCLETIVKTLNRYSHFRLIHPELRQKILARALKRFFFFFFFAAAAASEKLSLYGIRIIIRNRFRHKASIFPSHFSLMELSLFTVNLTHIFGAISYRWPEGR